MARSILIAAALLLLSATAALSQQQVCAPYSDLTQKLQAEYKEALAGRGIDATGRLLEIWSGPEGGTILLVRPADMLSCIMLIGEKGTRWQPEEPQPDGPKS